MSTQTNLNDARSQATRARLVKSAIDSLVEVGFTRTTGVEICRRAELTRGALNHHFPALDELFVCALHSIYADFLRVDVDPQVGRLEAYVLQAYGQITQPEFKAVLELWMASRNDPQFGARLGAAITDGAVLFTPEAVLADGELLDDPGLNATYRTIFEALIGLGVGRAVGGGEAVGHERVVLEFLLDLARRADAAV